MIYLIRRESGGIGGAEKAIIRMQQAFQSKGYRCDCLFAGKIISGKRLHGTRGSSWLKALRFVRSVNKFLSKEKDQGKSFYVISLERGIMADLYRAGDGVHLEWLRIKGNPWIRFFNPLNWIYPCLEKFSMKRARFIIANSHIVADQIYRYYPSFQDKVKVIHNGYDPSLYNPKKCPKNSLKKEIRIKKARKLLLFVGSGWIRKGLQKAIEILAALNHSEPHQWHLMVAGKGEPKEWDKTILKLGQKDAVSFLGVVESLTPYYQFASFMILPTEYDPFSNACLEALACHCPVITTVHNGASEIIDDGKNGILLKGIRDIENIKNFKPSGDFLRKAQDYRQEIRAYLALIEFRDKKDKIVKG